MKRLFVIFCCLVLFLPMLVFSQTRVFHREYKYKASEDDGRNQAREKAIKEAQALLLQDVGVIVESRQQLITKSLGRDALVDFQQEVNVYTLGKVNTTIIPGTEKWDGHTYFAKFAMEVDTAALYKYLGNIMKQKEQARADSLAQINKARADSLANARKISDLELAVITMRKSLEKEQKKEKPLEIEKNKKHSELKSAEAEKNKAQNAFDRERKSDNPNLQRMANEQEILKVAKNDYETKLMEYDIAYTRWLEANERVETAKRNLQTAEEKLAKEFGIENNYYSKNDAVYNLEKDVDYMLSYDGSYSRDAKIEKGSSVSDEKNYTLLEHSRINFGIGGMLNFVDYGFNGVSEENPKTSGSASVGLITSIPVPEESMTLYLEFYFTYRGLGNDQCSSDCTRIVEYALDIPLIMTLFMGSGVPDSPISHVYFEGGFSFGVPLSTTIYATDTYIDRKKFDFGIVLGMGFRFMDYLELGPRIGWNISDYAKNAEGMFGFYGILLRIGKL